ncbi:hypothetical protein ACFQLX_01765 [Streptomyces polyrhachis]|uniref:Uncharacterized protein n=1 Tax=Streptomyces polyrhachis TaxID=1282885 RepID=A0ABW2GA78_9ACTN
MAVTSEVAAFEDHRGLLTGLAYRMLGRFAAAPAPDAAERAAVAVSLAMLVVLEPLSPLERSEAAVRQLAGRARRHVEERRPRYDVDEVQRRDLTERFLAAAGGGGLGALMELLAPDVTLITDGGGKVRAALRVIDSADKVGRFLVGVSRRVPEEPEFVLREVNGALSLVLLSRGRPDSVFTAEAAQGRIKAVYVMRNPDKLHGLRG